MGARKTLTTCANVDIVAANDLRNLHESGRNRIIYRRRIECDLKIFPYNLQMIMDWDLHINRKYSGSLIVLSTCTNIVTRVLQGKSVLIWVLSKSMIPWMR